MYANVHALNVTMKEYQQITVSFTIVYHVHVTLLYTQCLYAAMRSSILSLFIYSLLHSSRERS